MTLIFRCKSFSAKSIVIVQLLLLYRSLTQGIDQLSPNEVAVNGAFLTLHGYASNGPRLGRYDCRSMLQCGHLCLKNFRCLSFNYQELSIRNGFCELSGVSVGSKHERDKLIRKMPGFVFVQLAGKALVLVFDKGIIEFECFSWDDRNNQEKLKTKPRSCLDYLRTGRRYSGFFNIFDEKGTSMVVYCDLTSEPKAAWTLIMSERTPGFGLFKRVPLFKDNATNESIPNWDAYRLSLFKMKQLRLLSSHWRITCSFQLDGLVYRDYVRGKFADLDIIDFKRFHTCMSVEYVNVRGYSCSNCQMPWWQNEETMLHHDSSKPQCGYNASKGAVRTEDNFGFYNRFNPSFRCTESGRESTTNHWFGSYLN